jgi:hypothetical protein
MIFPYYDTTQVQHKGGKEKGTVERGSSVCMYDWCLNSGFPPSLSLSTVASSRSTFQITGNKQIDK